MGNAIGIDLGTFNSAAAYCLPGDRVDSVESRFGPTLYGKNFPSFVKFDRTGRVECCGSAAKREMAIAPQLVVWGVKRLVGLSHKTAERLGELQRFGYETEASSGDGGILIKIGPERYAPEHVLRLILENIKADAEDPACNPLIGPRVERAVVTVPAYFDGTRTRRIEQAALDAGFAEVETIAEPTAAAMRFGLHLGARAADGLHVLAFDLGAGTLDVTVMNFLVEGGRLVAGEERTAGDAALGGLDMDDILAKHLMRRHGLEGLESSWSVFLDEVERAKVRLSTRDTAPIDVPGARTIDLTRAELEEVLADTLDRLRGPIRTALEEVEASSIDEVLFVGGPTSMPCVRATVADELRKLGASSKLVGKLTRLESEIAAQGGFPEHLDPMSSVAKGAALQASGVVCPSVRTDPNGYGTILGGDYYLEMIKPHSAYPISAESTLIHGNPAAQAVPVPLARKLSFNESGTTVHKYYDLGEYHLFIESTGEPPEVKLTLRLDENGSLVAKLTHVQRRASTEMSGLDSLCGDEAGFQEHTHPNETGWKAGESVKPVKWTREQYEAAVHAARTALDFAGQSANASARRQATSLEGVIRAADVADTHDILNEIPRLLKALHGARVIDEQTFHRMRQDVVEITKMRRPDSAAS